MNDPATHKAAKVGWILLAICLPLGMTLEALHAWKVPVYLDSPMRRELWRLAHAHGNLLGILLLAFAGLGERFVPQPAERARVSLLLRIGAVLMPLGFFTGGILDYEGDPSLGVLLVPAGAVALLVALVQAAFAKAE